MVPIVSVEPCDQIKTYLEAATERAGRAHRIAKRSLWAFERGCPEDISTDGLELAQDLAAKARLDLVFVQSALQGLRATPAHKEMMARTRRTL